MKKILLSALVFMLLITSCLRERLAERHDKLLSKNRSECVTHHSKNLESIKYKVKSSKLVANLFYTKHLNRWNRFHDFTGKKETYLVKKKFKTKDSKPSANLFYLKDRW